MSKVKEFYLGSPSAETQRLMEAWQKEMDCHNTLSPEQILSDQKEKDELLKSDPAFDEFLTGLDNPDIVPF